MFCVEAKPVAEYTSAQRALVIAAPEKLNLEDFTQAEPCNGLPVRQ